MGLIRVAISETVLCVFGLFWSDCVYDYCFIVFSLTFVAGRGGGMRRLVVWVFGVALSVSVPALCCKQMAQFLPLTCSLSVILTGVRVVSQSLSAKNSSVNSKHANSPLHTHTHTHSHICVQCTLSIKSCKVGYKRWRTKEAICIANETTKTSGWYFPFHSETVFSF